VFGVEGVTPISNRKQVKDIGDKFRCKMARNGKVKKSKFYPPPKKMGIGIGCYSNCRGKIDNTVMRERIITSDMRHRNLNFK